VAANPRNQLHAQAAQMSGNISGGFLLFE